MLKKSIDKAIEIVIDNEFTKFTWDLYVREFHVYQTGCSPIISEKDSECRHEKENEECLMFVIGVIICRDPSRSYSTEYIQIHIQILAASQLETLQQKCPLFSVSVN